MKINQNTKQATVWKFAAKMSAWSPENDQQLDSTARLFRTYIPPAVVATLTTLAKKSYRILSTKFCVVFPAEFSWTFSLNILYYHHD